MRNVIYIIIAFSLIIIAVGCTYKGSNNDILSYEEKIRSLEDSLLVANTNLLNIENELVDNKYVVSTLEDTINNLNNEITIKVNAISDLEAQISGLEGNDNSDLLNQLQVELETKIEESTTLQLDLQTKTSEYLLLQSEIMNKNADIVSLQNEIASITHELSEKSYEIDNLKKELSLYSLDPNFYTDKILYLTEQANVNQNLLSMEVPLYLRSKGYDVELKELTNDVFNEYPIILSNDNLTNLETLKKVVNYVNEGGIFISRMPSTIDLSTAYTDYMLQQFGVSFMDAGGINIDNIYSCSEFSELLTGVKEDSCIELVNEYVYQYIPKSNVHVSYVESSYGMKYGVYMEIIQGEGKLIFINDKEVFNDLMFSGDNQNYSERSADNIIRLLENN